MQMNTYIMIAGIKRSGSTWQANAVRLLCEELYSPEVVWIGEEYEGEAQAKITINKVHPFIKPLAERADYVLTSYRNLWAIRASWKRFKGTYPKAEQFRKWVDDLVYWNLYADHMTHFSVLGRAESEREELTKIAEVLEIKEHLGEQGLRTTFRKLRSLSPPEEKDYDERTLMFSDHITNPKYE